MEQIASTALAILATGGATARRVPDLDRLWESKDDDKQEEREQWLQAMSAPLSGDSRLPLPTAGGRHAGRASDLVTARRGGAGEDVHAALAEVATEADGDARTDLPQAATKAVSGQSSPLGRPYGSLAEPEIAAATTVAGDGQAAGAAWRPSSPDALHGSGRLLQGLAMNAGHDIPQKPRRAEAKPGAQIPQIVSAESGLASRYAADTREQAASTHRERPAAAAQLALQVQAAQAVSQAGQAGWIFRFRNWQGAHAVTIRSRAGRDETGFSLQPNTELAAQRLSQHGRDGDVVMPALPDARDTA